MSCIRSTNHRFTARMTRRGEEGTPNLAFKLMNPVHLVQIDCETQAPLRRRWRGRAFHRFASGVASDVVRLRNIVPALSKSSRVLAVDLRGIGDSDRSEMGMTPGPWPLMKARLPDSGGNLVEKEVEIRTPDGKGGFFCQPAKARSSPGILFLTDIGGTRASQRARAARIRSERYAMLMPNLFYHTGNPPFFEPGAAVGNEKFKQRRRELSSPLTPCRANEGFVCTIPQLQPRRCLGTAVL